VRLSVVVPAYNEARRLGTTLPRILEYVARSSERAEIIVVDDGSQDGTGDVVTGLARAVPAPIELRLLQSPHNRGKGASVRRGMLAARGAHVMFTDADLSAPIEEATKLRARLDDGYDVAIGSRRLAGADIQVRQGWTRRLAGGAFSGLVAALVLPGVADSQCGFKAFRHAAAAAIFARQRLEGFGFDVEILWLARRLGYRLIEVPIVWRDDPRSHIRLVRDSAGMLVDVARVRLNAWRGAYDGDA
jgi:dolichyl-phosphate beta-glucosyltransferase